MPTKLNPYLGFKNNAREAMEFYKTVFGGSLTMNTYKETYASQSPADDNKIMHAQLDTENGMTIMASDAPEGSDHHTGSNFSISLSGENEEELTKYFQKLSKDGKIVEPLEKAPWGDTFGMVTDKYGVNWMVNISGQSA